MAQFEWDVDASGQKKPRPGPAKLVFMRPGVPGAPMTLVDPDSRVFHKAACWRASDGSTRVLTIGGTEAVMKLWRWEAGAWHADELYRGAFGGKWNRLRDVEVGDVDGDGASELIVATHDQGVVLVGKRDGDRWRFDEIDRKAETFVHEIELGDADKDGIVEIFATPSEPNRARASTHGSLVRYQWDTKAKRFVRSVVATLEGSHAKEILTADLDGDGAVELYAAVEAELKTEDGELAVSRPVEVRRYGYAKGRFVASTVATLPDALQARVLIAASLTQPRDGKSASAGPPRGQELIVTTMKDGVWRIRPPALPGAPWMQTQLTDESSGFEHAAGVADTDGDGQSELYVFGDDQDELARHHWNGTSFSRKVIGSFDKSDIVWSIEGCAP